jgi:hypothetical protein
MFSMKFQGVGDGVIQGGFVSQHFLEKSVKQGILDYAEVSVIKNQESKKA